MEPTTSSEEVLICQTCGDEGFTNAFVYCVKCLGFVVHRYCVDVMPRTFDEIVPWFCEDCKPAVPNQFALPKVKSSQSRKEEGGHIRATYPKKKQKKERDIASLIAGTEEVNCREDTTEPDGECVPLIDSLLKEASMKSILSHGQITPCVVAGMEEGLCQKQASEDDQLDCNYSLSEECTNRKRNGLATKTKEHRLQNSLQHGTQKTCKKMVDSIEHSWSDTSPTTVYVKNKKGVAYSVEEQRDESQPPCETDRRMELTEHEKLLSDSSYMKNESDKKTNHECQAEVANQMQTKQDISTSKPGTDVSQSAEFAKNVQHNHYLFARPVIDPVWRDYFLAHRPINFQFCQFS